MLLGEHMLSNVINLSIYFLVKLEKENSKKISGEKNFATKENLSQFEQIQKSRSDEASRSVLIKVKGKADVSYLLDEFKFKNVPVKCACYSEPVRINFPLYYCIY